MNAIQEALAPVGQTCVYNRRRRFRRSNACTGVWAKRAKSPEHGVSDAKQDFHFFDGYVSSVRQRGECWGRGSIQCESKQDCVLCSGWVTAGNAGQHFRCACPRRTRAARRCWSCGRSPPPRLTSLCTPHWLRPVSTLHAPWRLRVWGRVCVGALQQPQSVDLRPRTLAALAGEDSAALSGRPRKANAGQYAGVRLK